MKKQCNHIASGFEAYWIRYLSYIKDRLSIRSGGAENNLDYWQKELFVKTTALALPVCLLALIPSVLIFWNDGSPWISVIDLMALSAIFLFLFCTGFSIRIKMGIAVSIATMLAIFLIAAIGSFGVGSIYLLAIAVVMSLLFTNTIAYLSIALNAIILFSFMMLLDTHIVSWPIVHSYKKELWLIYTLNFCFLNFMVVVSIRHLLTGLQTTMEQEQKLFKVLQDELQSKTVTNALLAESEEHYKSLFFSNPTPMWIFDPESLLFLQVNDAAITQYGFSSSEFMTMTVGQIRVEPVKLVIDRLEDTLANKLLFSNVALHQKKNGAQFYAKIKSSAIPFHGREALLVIAHDITSQIEYNKAIDEQNAKLKKIAYFQSHMVRAPLARIKGLWSLILLDVCDNLDPEVCEFMHSSIDELDNVIKDVIKDSEIVSSHPSLSDQRDSEL